MTYIDTCPRCKGQLQVHCCMTSVYATTNTAEGQDWECLYQEDEATPERVVCPDCEGLWYAYHMDHRGRPCFEYDVVGITHLDPLPDEEV